MMVYQQRTVIFHVTFEIKPIRRRALHSCNFETYQELLSYMMAKNNIWYPSSFFLCLLSLSYFNVVDGYGFAHIPATPGRHKNELVTWRPSGAPKNQLLTAFLGATPELKDKNLIHEPVDRFRLLTQSMGTVHANLWVAIRNFAKTGVAL